MVGTTLSHYRIVAELGRGGMGIVYKAEDTKLDRTVAIKVLPSAALASEDDRARFYREAKAAAQLHHPHIASVFEIDEAVPEGSKDDDVRPFIAMEFIAGETIRDRIDKGPLKLNECIRIASEAAAGLKAAHDKDIVHRDIKAANIMLDENGSAKILDFGLAQTAQSTKLTRMGSTLGTVAFMSPEQARGEDVDQRTDLWSLGVVLYEMVAGRSPFPGDYEQAVVYEILNQDPEPLTALRTGVPMDLETVVAKCLSKNPDLRYPSAAALIVDLKRIDTSSAVRASRMTSQIGTATPAPVPVPTKERPWMFISAAIGVATLLVGLLLGSVLFKNEPTPLPVIKAQLVLPNALSPLEAAITPDDRSLFYVVIDPGDGLRRLARYDFETGSREVLPRTENARFPTISFDGRWIAYQSYETIEWWKVLTSGGEPILVPRSGSRLGARAVFSQSGGLLISDSTWSLVEIGRDGTHSVLATLGQEGMTSILGGQRVSPTGLFVTISDWVMPGIPVTSWILRPGATEPVVLMEEAWIHTITASGHALFVRGDNNLPQQTIAVPIDLKSGAILGDGVALGVRSYPPAVSPSGLLVYEELSGAETYAPSQLYRVTASGSEELLFTLPGESSQEIAVSSDGAMLAVNAGIDDGGLSDIYLVDLTLGTNTRLTQGGGYDVPSWGGGNDVLYFDYEVSSNEYTIMSRRADGSGTNERVLPDGVGAGDPDLTSDNRLIVFSSDDLDIWGYDMVADSAFAIVVDDADLFKPDVSPDGKFVVYLHDSDAYCGSVQVSAVHGSSEPIEIATDGCYPVWTHDGSYIYYQDVRTISRIPVATDPVFNQLGPAEEVYSTLNTRRVGTPGSLYYDVAADGTLYVSHAPIGADETHLIWVVANWFEELNRIAPRSY